MAGRLARTASEASMAARAGARFNLVLKKDVSIRPQVLLSGTRRSPGGLCRDSRDPRQGHLSSGFLALHAQSSPRERTERISQLSGARALRSQQIPAFSRAPRAHSQKQKTRPGPAWLKVSSRARPSSAARIRLFRRRAPAPLSKR